VSPRHRLGVALLLDPPAATEVDGLRRALGDTSLGHVAPHITLVPPVNVRATEVGAAVDVVRSAAHNQEGAISLVLGPVATFAPANPVVYLSVGGPGAGDLRRLHEAVLSGPLERPERWPWVPHVTLADGLSDDRIKAAVTALGPYTTGVALDRLVLLEEMERCWSPLADARFGPPAVVGRGGLELEITQGRTPPPDAVAMVGSAALGPELAAALMTVAGPGADVLVLTGRRRGTVAGMAMAWAPDEPGAPVHACVVVDDGARRQGVGRALLLALEAQVRQDGWAVEGVRGHGPSGFFRHSSAWVREFAPGPWEAGP
jgi:2'-5' RNA ligase/GNAT superfamily N-acetyltransferase